MRAEHLGYNSIGALAFLSSCGWAFKAVVDENGHVRAAAASGALAGVSVFAYPPMIVAALFAQGLLCITMWRRGDTRAALVPLLAFVTALTPIILLAASVGLEALGPVLRFAVSDGVHVATFRKIAGTTAEFVRTVLGRPAPFLIVLLALVVRKRPVASLGLLLCVLPVAALGIEGFARFSHPMVQISAIILTLGLAAPLILVLVRDDPRAIGGAVTFVLPGLAGGFMMTYSSALGIGVAGQGILPAAVASLLFVVLYATNKNETRLDRDTAYALVIAGLFILSVAAILGAVKSTTVFHEDPNSALTSRVEVGPWTGLLTTADRRALVESLDRDLGDSLDTDDRILCFNWMPGTYLVSKARVVAPTIGNSPSVSGRRLIVDRIRAGSPPTVVVEDLTWSPVLGPDDPFRDYLRDEGFAVSSATNWYRVYRKPPQ